MLDINLKIQNKNYPYTNFDHPLKCQKLYTQSDENIFLGPSKTVAYYSTSLQTKSAQGRQMSCAKCRSNIILVQQNVCNF